MKLAHSRLMNDVVLEGFFRVSARDVEFRRTSWKISKAIMKNFVRYSRNVYSHGVEIAGFGGLRLSITIGSPYRENIFPLER